MPPPLSVTPPGMPFPGYVSYLVQLNLLYLPRSLSSLTQFLNQGDMIPLPLCSHSTWECTSIFSLIPTTLGAVSLSPPYPRRLTSSSYMATVANRSSPFLCVFFCTWASFCWKSKHTHACALNHLGNCKTFNWSFKKPMAFSDTLFLVDAMNRKRAHSYCKMNPVHSAPFELPHGLHPPVDFIGLG